MTEVSFAEAAKMSPDLLVRMHYEAMTEKLTTGKSESHHVLAYEVLHRLNKLERVVRAAQS